MKIGILTFQFVDNYGAILQAYALKKSLSDNNNEVSIINYDNYKLRASGRSKISKNKTKVWNCIRRFIFGNKKHKGFDRFRKKYLEINNEPICDITGFSNYINSHDYDCYIVGSDQVWNPLITNYDETYLLNTIPENKLKIAYAASFGLTSVDKNWLDVVATSLDRFDKVSVREANARKCLINAGVQKDIGVVADPVFLLEQEKWDIIADKKNIGDYILCYIMPGDKYVEKNIEKNAHLLREKFGYKIIYIGRKEYKKFRPDGKDIIDASPADFLGYFKDAKIVLTNSFHGTAFSIIFRKEFYTFVNPNIDDTKQLSSRIVDLLSECALENRCVTKEKIEFSSVHYEASNDKIESFVNRSKLFIDAFITDDRGH